MSYGLIGHFVDVHNHKVLASVDLDFLKILNDYSYSKDMGGIMPSGDAKDEDYPEVCTSMCREFYDYYKKELLDDERLKDPIEEYNNKRYSYGVDFPRYIADLDWINENKELLDAYKLDSYKVATEKDKVDGIMLFKRYIDKRDGSWYRRSDFENGKKEIDEEIRKLTERFNKLENIKDSKDFFEMSEEGRERFTEEIGYVQEELEEYGYKKDALDRIISYFNFWIDWYYKDKDDEYVGYYTDNRKIEVFIWVC